MRAAVREGREDFAKNAKGKQKIEDFFRVLRATFAPFAYGFRSRSRFHVRLPISPSGRQMRTAAIST